MNAIRKADMKTFLTKPKDVCRIEDGSTNSYLSESRAIETFLTGVEPKYNAALKNVSENKLDAETVQVLSGFVSYVAACSPAGMRINTEPLRRQVEQTTRILEAAGRFPEAPASLGGKSLTDLIEQGIVRVNVDGKFPQAIGISMINRFVAVFGNSHWETLDNPFAECPFFTSDYPVAIEVVPDRQDQNRIVPLSPSLAVRICPRPTRDRSSGGLDFSRFTHCRKTLSRSEVVNLNRLIVRCAETTVFFRDNHDWIESFVRKNAGFRIETKSLEIPSGQGLGLFFYSEVTDKWERDSSG